MYGIMTKISSVSSQNQLLMLKNAPEFTKIMTGEITYTTSSCNFTDDVWTKKNFSTFSYKLVKNFSYHDFGKFWCIFKH